MKHIFWQNKKHMVKIKGMHIVNDEGKQYLQKIKP